MQPSAPTPRKSKITMRGASRKNSRQRNKSAATDAATDRVNYGFVFSVGVAESKAADRFCRVASAITIQQVLELLAWHPCLGAAHKCEVLVRHDAAGIPAVDSGLRRTSEGRSIRNWHQPMLSCG